MSEKNMAVLQFLGYRVVNILYDCAPEFEFPDDEISYHFNFSKTNTLISSNDFQENLEVNVFYSQDGDFANAPYKLTVEIAGRYGKELSNQAGLKAFTGKIIKKENEPKKFYSVAMAINSFQAQLYKLKPKKEEV